jgi:hypothetical protein
MRIQLMPKSLFAALLAVWIVGCTHSSAQQTTDAIPLVKVRVILTFNFAPPQDGDVQLNALLSATCHCQPLYIRPYLNNASIYQITLQPEQSFAAFASEMMARGATQGIRGVEQDGLQHH